MAGGNEKVIPLLVGILVFLLIMSFIISSLGPIDPFTEQNPVPAQFALGEGYDMYTPTYIISAVNVTNYWQGSFKALAFSHPGVSNVYGHVIRANTWYHAGSIHPWEKYKDFVAIDFGYIADASQFALSYATISQTMNTTASNITHYDFQLTAVTSGKSGNYTLVVEVHHLATKTADLYANHYNLTLTSPIEISPVNFWTAFGYLLTFNTNWIPTYPILAVAMSAVIDLIIVLCIIRLVW